MGIDHEPAPPGVREDLFSEAGGCCELCGATGPRKGGTAQLEAHHIVPIPEGGSQKISNLTSLCRSCHSWVHSLRRLRASEVNFDTMSYQPSPVDLQIVLAIGVQGPVTTRQIADFAATSVETASQRLMKMTALEVVEPTRDLYDQSSRARWNFAGLVKNSAVGQLPDDAKKAARLARDEMIRRRANRGESHHAIAQDLGLSRRTIFKSIDRARALRPPVPDINEGIVAPDHSTAADD